MYINILYAFLHRLIDIVSQRFSVSNLVKHIWKSNNNLNNVFLSLFHVVYYCLKNLGLLKYKVEAKKSNVPI